MTALTAGGVVKKLQMPPTPLGAWYVDEFTTVGPFNQPQVPNAFSAVPLVDQFYDSPRFGFFLGNFSGMSISNTLVAAGDGSITATQFILAGGAWQWYIGITGLPAGVGPFGPITVGVWAKSAVGGAYIQFAKQFGTGVTSSKFMLTSTYARYSFTFSYDGLADIGLAGQGDSPAGTIVLYDITCYSGSVDLGANQSSEIGGHIILSDTGGNTFPAPSGGILTVQSDSSGVRYGTVNFPFPTLQSTLEFTVLSVSQLAPYLAPYSTPYFQAWLSNFNNDATVMGPSAGGGFNNNASPGIALGPAFGGSNALVSFSQGEQFLFDVPGIEAKGAGLSCIAHTWSTSGQSGESWINGVKVMASSGLTGISDPGFNDLYFSIYAHTADHPAMVYYNSLAFYERVLTDAEIRLATMYLRARATFTGNVLQTSQKWLFALGDQNILLQFPFLAAKTTTFRLRGASYGDTAQAGGFYITGVFASAFTSQIAAAVALKPKMPSGQEMICVVYCGRNDMAVLGSTASATAAQLASQLDLLRAAGIKVIACTLFDSFATSQSSYNTARAAFNTIVSGWSGIHADAILDLASVTHLGPDGSFSNATYFDASGILQTPAGDVLLAVPTVAAINSV